MSRSWGVSTLRRVVSGEKQNPYGNREAWEISRETGSNEVKISGRLRFFWECLPKIRDDISDFREVFCLRTVLLKQRSLELSPLIRSKVY